MKSSGGGGSGGESEVTSLIVGGKVSGQIRLCSSFFDLPILELARCIIALAIDYTQSVCELGTCNFNSSM